MKNIILKIIFLPNKLSNFITLHRKKAVYDKTLKINGKNSIIVVDSVVTKVFRINQIWDKILQNL